MANKEKDLGIVVGPKGDTGPAGSAEFVSNDWTLSGDSLDGYSIYSIHLTELTPAILESGESIQYSSSDLSDLINLSNCNKIWIDYGNSYVKYHPVSRSIGKNYPIECDNADIKIDTSFAYNMDKNTIDLKINIKPYSLSGRLTGSEFDLMIVVNYTM